MANRAWPPAPDAAPELLSAWHGPFGFFGEFRKVLIADCRLMEHAKAADRGEKLTQVQADDLAHSSDEYVGYLTAGLTGRVAYERAIREQVGA